MLVLPVGFPMVTDDPVGVGYWSSLSVGRGNFSVKGIVKSLEKTVSKVHISNDIDAIWECHRSWELSVSVSPVVLNTFHVPLIDKDNNFLLGAFINLSEKVIVSPVDENTLEFWEENCEGLNIPIDEIWVEAFLCELSWLGVVES